MLQLKLINVEVFCVSFIEANPHTSLYLQSPELASLILVILNLWLIRDEYLSYRVIKKYKQTKYKQKGTKEEMGLS